MIARCQCRTSIVVVTIASVMVAGMAVAQQPPLAQPLPEQQPGQIPQRQLQGQTQQRPGAPTAQANMTDAQLAAWLLVDNHGEVALARLAQQRAQNDDVRKFATQMVEDHTKFIDKIQPFAGQYAQMVGQQGQQRINQTNRSAGNLDIVEVKQRLGQKCLESTRSELEKKEGTQFDKCYAAQQAMMHMAMLDTLEIFRNYASGELRPILEEGIKTTEEHLKHAKDLAESKMERRDTDQARRYEEENRN